LPKCMRLAWYEAHRISCISGFSLFHSLSVLISIIAYLTILKDFQFKNVNCSLNVKNIWNLTFKFNPLAALYYTHTHTLSLCLSLSLSLSPNPFLKTNFLLHSLPHHFKFSNVWGHFLFIISHSLSHHLKSSDVWCNSLFNKNKVKLQ
jgi:hypothetical protein